MSAATATSARSWCGAPLYIQERVRPKVPSDDLPRDSKRRRDGAADAMPDLFADFNGPPGGEARTGFYRRDANWSNRTILGDSFRVMGSLAEREGLRRKLPRPASLGRKKFLTTAPVAPTHAAIRPLAVRSAPAHTA